jgi:hypothetical protein
MPSPLDRFLGDSAEEVDLGAREDEASENLRALVSPEGTCLASADFATVS